MEVRADSSQSRRFARVPFDAPVRLTRLSTGQSLELAGVNLSENGLFLETVIPFAHGEIFRLSFPSADGGFQEVSAARVAWRRPFSPERAPGQPPGVGLSFMFMRPDDREALRTLVEEGGVAPRPMPRTVASRAPVAPHVLGDEEEEAPRPAPVTSWGDPDAMELMDVGPFGWLLVVSLAMAAMASLLIGMHPPAM